MRQQHTIQILILLAMLVMGVGQVWAQTHTEQYDFDGDGVLETYNVVYIDYKNGNDANTGESASSPVKSWSVAYSKLPAYIGTTDADRDAAWDKNIIVVRTTAIGTNATIKESDTSKKPATITGEWPWTGVKVASGGCVVVSNSTSKDGTGARIGAPTRFKNIIFRASTSGRFSCHLFDVFFDEGISMSGFQNLQANSGAIDGHSAADFHLQLYADQINSSTFPTQTKPMMVKIYSGQFGRILASRIAGEKAISTYIIGRHNSPLMVEYEIDVKSKTNKGKYTDDIGYLAAGSTQGTVYGDEVINIKSATIGTLVAGSQGNAIAMGSLKLPCSTYCGRTTINLTAENNADVMIENYIGACQGRVYGSDGICDAYFYGISTLNMYGGTIKSNVFASTAGISGYRSDDADYYIKGFYTNDQRIPYPGSYAYGVDYLPFDRNKSMIPFTSTFNGNVNLEKTQIIINITGGLVKGNVYGGSFGYSSPLSVTYAPAHAGRLFGNTSVNISGGTIEGSVYGGGAGSIQYYTDATAGNKNNFKDVAQVYGNTQVLISGSPTIVGNIYGGGAGVSSGAIEFEEIAKVYGNTNVTIDADADWEFSGNIYGGGAMGTVEGDTNVQILGGIINGKVFGAGQGEEGHPDKAKVTGTSNVTVGE